jgi:hypothetical protein
MANTDVQENPHSNFRETDEVFDIITRDELKKLRIFRKQFWGLKLNIFTYFLRLIIDSSANNYT